METRPNSRYMDDDGNLIPVNADLLQAMENWGYTSHDKVSYANVKKGPELFEKFAVQYHIPVFTTAKEVEKRYVQMYDLILKNDAQKAQAKNQTKKQKAQSSADALRNQAPTNNVNPFATANGQSNATSQTTGVNDSNPNQTLPSATDNSLNAGKSTSVDNPTKLPPASNATDSVKPDVTPNDAKDDANTPPNPPLSATSKTPASGTGDASDVSDGRQSDDVRRPNGSENGADTSNDTSNPERGDNQTASGESEQHFGSEIPPTEETPKRRMTPAGGVDFGGSQADVDTSKMNQAQLREAVAQKKAHKKQVEEETRKKQIEAEHQKPLEDEQAKLQQQQAQSESESTSNSETPANPSQTPVSDASVDDVDDDDANATDLSIDGLVNGVDDSKKTSNDAFAKLFTETAGIQTLGPIQYNHLFADELKDVESKTVMVRIDSGYTDVLRSMLFKIFKSPLLNNISYSDLIYSNSLYMMTAAGYLSLADYRKYCLAKVVHWVGKKQKRIDNFKTYKSVAEAVRDDSDDNVNPIQARWYLLMSQFDPTTQESKPKASTSKADIDAINQRLDEITYQVYRNQAVGEAVLMSQHAHDNDNGKSMMMSLFGQPVKSLRVILNEQEDNLVKPKLTMKRTKISQRKFRRK